MSTVLKSTYAIKNKVGKYFAIDEYSGGYPIFMCSLKTCKFFNSLEEAKEILYGEYGSKQFKSAFEGCKIVKITISEENI